MVWGPFEICTKYSVTNFKCHITVTETDFLPHRRKKVGDIAMLLWEGTTWEWYCRFKWWNLTRSSVYFIYITHCLAVDTIGSLWLVFYSDLNFENRTFFFNLFWRPRRAPWHARMRVRSCTSGIKCQLQIFCNRKSVFSQTSCVCLKYQVTVTKLM